MELQKTHNMMFYLKPFCNVKMSRKVSQCHAFEDESREKLGKWESEYFKHVIVYTFVLFWVSGKILWEKPKKKKKYFKEEPNNCTHKISLHKTPISINMKLHA